MFFPLSRLEYCSDFSKVSEPNYIVTEKMLTNKREQTTLVDIESRCIKDSGRFGKKRHPEPLHCLALVVHRLSLTTSLVKAVSLWVIDSFDLIDLDSFIYKLDL
jgi:hypothetical protein